MGDHVSVQETQRQGSIRSVASNSSIGSNVSLVRRSRTRTRSRTVTGASSPRPPDGVPGLPMAEVSYLETNLTQEPVSIFSTSADDVSNTPLRPPRSPLKTTQEVVHEQTDDTIASNQETPFDVTNLAPELRIHHRPLTKMTSQTSGMQILPTATQPQPPPSAFSRDPHLTGVDSSTVNMRDSVSTQFSTLSSSVYPPSTSTTSGPDSPPSPRSMVDEQENCDISSYNPKVGETHEFDSDDVSYRLRLLVNNNYFLPPAHSKPSPADFAALGSNTPKKPSTPTFFDRFRSRSKSKPTTPTGSPSAVDPLGPALRTTADSISTAHLLHPQPPRNPSHNPQGPYPETRTGRVVVVRERMQDLAVAAKQAEKDMKARGFRHQDPQTSSTAFDSVIDPTDAVDLPLPSSNYPFAVQASALHGLGVQDSLGAALLADRLPPPHSPGMFSLNPEDHWRKALLQQAVHHSLDSISPDTSFSINESISTPLVSPCVGPSQGPSRGASPIVGPLLEQRIISNPRFSDVSTSTVPRKKSNQSVASMPTGRPKKSSEASASPHVLPPRSSTPAAPLTPLTPAPRKHLINASSSTSQSEFTKAGQGQSTSEDGLRSAFIRRAVSSPTLSDAYEADTRNMDMTPPPLPTPTISIASFSEMQESRVASRSSYYSDLEAFDDDLPRASVTLSVVDGRRSFSHSEYSQPSPTMSAFRDAPANLGDRPVYQSQWRPSIDHDALSNRESPIPRYTAMSPPPRISSSLAHFALSPPPRSSSFKYQVQTNRPSTSPHISGRNTPQTSTSLDGDTTLIINAPEPTTPPFPLAQRRGNSTGGQLSLDIPTTNIPLTIHSAPGPSSPTSFFDSIQSQPNAMDDLESSDESDDDEGVTHLTPPSPDRSDPRSRSLSITPATPRPFMRLGNHSTPYVSQAVENRRSSGLKGKQPVGNVPARAAFFTERSGKSDQGHGPPVSSFDFYKYVQESQENLVATSTEQSDLTQGSKHRLAVGPVSAWRSNSKAQESSKKLNGMLIQHMEAEKDTIKRIATTARSNIPVIRGL